MKRFALTLLLMVCSFSGYAHAINLVNPDFETGDYTGWDLYTTELGSTYVFPDLDPVVESFDTNNDGILSNAARFQVGTLFGTPLPDSGTYGYQGGGIYQKVYLESGLLSIDADIAAFLNYGGAAGHDSPGRFGLEVDGVEIANYEFDPIKSFEKLYGKLSGDALIENSGLHEIRFSVLAEGAVHENSPYRYIDDIKVGFTPTNNNVVPEPATVFLLGGGLAGMFWRSRKNKKA